MSPITAVNSSRRIAANCSTSSVQVVVVMLGLLSVAFEHLVEQGQWFDLLACKPVSGQRALAGRRQLAGVVGVDGKQRLALLDAVAYLVVDHKADGVVNGIALTGAA